MKKQLKKILGVVFVAVLIVSVIPVQSVRAENANSAPNGHKHEWKYEYERDVLKAYCISGEHADQCKYQGKDKALSVDFSMPFYIEEGTGSYARFTDEQLDEFKKVTGSDVSITLGCLGGKKSHLFKQLVSPVTRRLPRVTGRYYLRVESEAGVKNITFSIFSLDKYQHR